MLTTRPRGTNDILPGEISRWHHLEEVLRQVAGLYGFQEIRTPIFEHTELFQRGVGETTDIVEKEMYTFFDRGKRSLTLRPEATASAVRAFVEHKMYAEAQPVKLYYLGPMFRYDRPQAGRYRQFHQFGVEVFGTREPGVDAEVIAMSMDIYQRLGLKNLTVELNSVGCPACRRSYRTMLQEFLEESKEKLCGICQDRFDKNPMRILDCKNEKCQELTKNAPTINDALCDDCREHFAGVQEYLNKMGVEYRLNPRLVRGLDYYTLTAFEIMAEGIGAQASIGGGGRYDGLIEQCGGPPVPGIGYAMGLERILLTMEQQGIDNTSTKSVQVYIASLGEKARLLGASLTQELRGKGIRVERDYQDKSLKAQMKAANRYNASYTLIIGEEELKNKELVLRRMQDGSQEVIPLDGIIEYLAGEIKEGDDKR